MKKPCAVLVVVIALLLPGCLTYAGGLDETEPKAFPYAFTAKDLYDNDITEAYWEDKVVFFVHYWATWCMPCIAEMPDIGAVAEEYGDRVGFIGLVDDFAQNPQGAVKIAEYGEIPFPMISAHTEGLEAVLEMLSTGYVPTTVILDKNGELIGEAIIGAHGTGYGHFLDQALNQN